ncbi:hypothetical protein BDV34DRAFT_191816 [Aspergillus parasiticus]|uniref:Uncharacterized protein n=1 Tax=Aspergillus parasiticus TaxID=5067 RepID=A0A5N6DQS6_ASPPA|nr:hypothetical protein BDV34DRAFT_191816 [Aspergillus parasiticus]
MPRRGAVLANHMLWIGELPRSEQLSIVWLSSSCEFGSILDLWIFTYLMLLHVRDALCIGTMYWIFMYGR